MLRDKGNGCLATGPGKNFKPSFTFIFHFRAMLRKVLQGDPELGEKS
jgi:hypothetical protein